MATGTICLIDQYLGGGVGVMALQKLSWFACAASDFDHGSNFLARFSPANRTGLVLAVVPMTILGFEIIRSRALMARRTLTERRRSSARLNYSWVTFLSNVYVCVCVSMSLRSSPSSEGCCPKKLLLKISPWKPSVFAGTLVHWNQKHPSMY